MSVLWTDHFFFTHLMFFFFFLHFSFQNWDTLRDGPAPYKPDRADEMSALLENVKHVAATSPEMPQLVKRITANFDDFQEVCIPSYCSSG